MFSLLNEAGHANETINCLRDILDAEISASDIKARCHELTMPEVLTVLKEVEMELQNVEFENMVLEDVLRNNEPRLLIGLTTEDIEKGLNERNFEQDVKEKNLEKEVKNRHIEKIAKRMYTSEQKNDASVQEKSNLSLSKLETSSFFKIRSNYSTATLEKRRDYKLNFKTKTELANKMGKGVRTHVQSVEREGFLKLKEINAAIATMNYELSETEEVLASFNKNVVDLGFNTTYGSISSEQFIKFCKHYLNEGMATCAKMRITSHTFAQDINSLRVRLISAEELKGMLSHMDFEALLITKENQIKLLEEKYSTCEHGRQAIGKTSFTKSKQKYQLLEKENKLKSIVSKIEDIQKQIARCDKECETTQDDVAAATDNLERLERRIEKNSVAPSIQDYIDLTVQLSALEKERKTLKHKIYLLNIRLKNAQHISHIKRKM